MTAALPKVAHCDALNSRICNANAPAWRPRRHALGGVRIGPYGEIGMDRLPAVFGDLAPEGRAGDGPGADQVRVLAQPGLQVAAGQVK